MVIARVGGLLHATLIDTSNTLCLPCYDGNGNISAWYDGGNSSLIERREYDSFGAMVSIYRLSTNAALHSKLHYGFSTKWRDSESNLLYYGYRFYNPTTQRWLNRDPIEENGGLNLYGFVGNDGVNQWDFLGLNQGEILSDLGLPVAWTTPTATAQLRDWVVKVRASGNYYAGNLMSAFLTRAGSYIATPADIAQVKKDLKDTVVDYVGDYLANDVGIDAPRCCAPKVKIDFSTSDEFGGTKSRGSISVVDSLSAYIYFGGVAYKFTGNAILSGTNAGTPSSFIDSECYYDVDVKVEWKDEFTFNITGGTKPLRQVNRYYSAGAWMEASGSARSFRFGIFYDQQFKWTAE